MSISFKVLNEQIKRFQDDLFRTKVLVISISQRLAALEKAAGKDEVDPDFLVKTAPIVDTP